MLVKCPVFLNTGIGRRRLSRFMPDAVVFCTAVGFVGLRTRLGIGKDGYLWCATIRQPCAHMPSFRG